MIHLPFLQEHMINAACVKGSTAGRQFGSMPICACSGPSCSGSASFFTCSCAAGGQEDTWLHQHAFLSAQGDCDWVHMWTQPLMK